ncbi:MAG: hypothetical protein NVS4B12_28760 [Ktedonobacteraceae bacterium]
MRISNTPVILPPPTRRAHRGLMTLIISALLVALVVVANILGQRLINGSIRTASGGNTIASGAFVQLPLNAAQVYAI